jgi:predicted transposase YdaD
VATPHDDLFRTTFPHPRHAAGWLRSVLPAAVVAAIDWATLAAANSRAPGLRLRAHLADLVFTVEQRARGGLVLVVVEHKAYADPELPAQLLRYCVHLRRLGQRRGGGPPPLVLPVVLYHGDEPLAPRGSPPDDAAAAALAELQPQMAFVVDDLSLRDEAAFRRADHTPLVQLTLLCLAFARGLAGSNVVAAIDRWGDLLAEVEADPGPPHPDDAIDAVGWYLLEVTEVKPEELQMAFARHLRHARDSILSTAQKLRLEGRVEGRAEGRTEGRAQGRTEGQAETVLRLLRRRFGPLAADVESRIRAGSSADVDRWTDRLLDAATLADVFAG